VVAAYLDGVLRAEGEFQAVGFVQVEGVGVGDGDVDEPGFEVVGLDEGYAWWELVVHLSGCQFLVCLGCAAWIV